MTITQNENQQIEVSSDADAMSGGSGRRSSSPTRRIGELTRQFLPPLLLGLVLISAWYYVSYGLLTDERRFLLRPPHEIIQVGFLDWGHFSEILLALWSSTRVALILSLIHI